jgi:hypothetical protein
MTSNHDASILSPSTSTNGNNDADNNNDRNDNMIDDNHDGDKGALANVIQELHHVNEILSICSSMILSMQLDAASTPLTSLSDNNDDTSASILDNNNNGSNDESLLNMLASTHDRARLAVTHLQAQCRLWNTSPPSSLDTKEEHSMSSPSSRESSALNGVRQRTTISTRRRTNGIMARHGFIPDRDGLCKSPASIPPPPPPNWTRLAMLLAILAIAVYCFQHSPSTFALSS